MENFGQVIVANLPIIGKTILGIIGAGLIIFAIIFILYRYRHKIRANVPADMYSINQDGNIIAKERIWGYEDPEDNIKKVYFKQLEESISLANATPILEKGRGKIRRVYQLFRYADGKIIISNPKLTPFNSQDGQEYIFQVDNELNPYKSWFASETVRAVEQRFKSEYKDQQKRMVFIMVACFVACVVIIGIGVYFATKIGMLSLEMSFSGLNSQTNLLITALQQNVSVVN